MGHLEVVAAVVVEVWVGSLVLLKVVLRRTPRHLTDQPQVAVVDRFCITIGPSSYVLFVL